MLARQHTCTPRDRFCSGFALIVVTHVMQDELYPASSGGRRLKKKKFVKWEPPKREKPKSMVVPVKAIALGSDVEVVVKSPKRAVKPPQPTAAQKIDEGRRQLRGLRKHPY